MSYQEITTENQLAALMAESCQKPQVIFKHSTRCYISSMVLKNTQNCFKDARADWHLLDLITFRSLSNEIEKLLNVPHQSPQLIIIHNRMAVYNASHEQIEAAPIFNHLDLLKP